MSSRSPRSSSTSRAGAVASFLRDTRANVAVIFALTLPITLGVSGLVTEYGYSLSVQATNQRTADLASYAAALAYNTSKSTTTAANAGKRVAALNGIEAASVTVDLVTSPRDSSKQAIRAVVRVNNQMFLAPILGVSNTVQVTTASYAEIGAAEAGAGGCIVALDASKSGVTLSGGTSISAASCAVSSNSKIEVPCGTSINAKGVTYGTTISEPCNGITAQSKVKTTTADPLAGNAGVTLGRARFSTLGNQLAPTAVAAPSITAPTGGTSIEFGWNDSATISQSTAAGCSASKSGSTWTLTCPQGKGKVYNFANITIGGGLNLSFNPTGLIDTAYNFSGPLNATNNTVFGPGNYTFGGAFTHGYGTTSFGNGTFNFVQPLSLSSSGTVSFGSGAFNFAKGLITGGSVGVTFGTGTYRMGQGTTGCYNGATFSLCHQSSTELVMPGDNFQFSSGIYNSQRLTLGGSNTNVLFQVGKSSSGDSFVNTGSGNATLANGRFLFSGGIVTVGGNTLTLGSGTGNVYQVGKSTNGDAVNLGGGSKTYLYDAATFELGGNLSSTLGGGSCLIIGAATNHDIRGNFDAAGAVVMGAGVYTIDGFFALGSASGGGNACPGYSNTVKGTNVTLVVSGKALSPSGSCVGQAFCVSAGYSNVELTSPTTGTYANLAVIGPAVITGGALFTQGGSGGRISGAFYFPVGPIALSGGAGVAGGTNCLQLIGSLISLSGGTTAASECVAASSGGSGASAKPRLVQ